MLKSEQTDVAVAALERIDDAETLGAIAQRARNKVAARRARTKLRRLEEPVEVRQHRRWCRSPPTTCSAPPISSAAPKRWSPCPTPTEATAAFTATRLAWAELQADVVVPEALTQQFDSAIDAAREAMAERQQEREAEAERGRVIAREQADRLAIVVEIEGLGRRGGAGPHRRAEGGVGHLAADAVGVRGLARRAGSRTPAGRSRIVSAGACWPMPQSDVSTRWPPSWSS